MKIQTLGRAVVVLSQATLIALALRGVNIPQQAEASKRQSNTYMDNFLLRDTKPLGLKGDRRLERLMRQPAIKWAIRAGARHILD